jgi:hypothetical protein
MRVFTIPIITTTMCGPLRPEITANGNATTIESAWFFNKRSDADKKAYWDGPHNTDHH